MSQEIKPTAADTMEEFFTRARANEGVKLDLTRPDGTPSVHWIRIRGIDSDAFKIANARKQREALDWASSQGSKITEGEISEKLAAGKLELLASLVISWSFPKECTPENVLEFLREAPQIGDEIDQIATRRRLFFALGSLNSTSSPATNSS